MGNFKSHALHNLHKTPGKGLLERPSFEQEMGETLVEIITPTVCAVKEAAPDSRGRSVSCCAQQFHFYHKGKKRTKGYRSLHNEK